jgi:hypothetical protein
MAALTYTVYNDSTNNNPTLNQAYNTVTVQKYLQVALDPLINYAIIYATLAWIATTT